MSVQASRDIATAFGTASNRRGKYFSVKRFGTPVVIVVVLAVLFWWLSSLTLDSIEQRTLNWPYLWERTYEHLRLTVIASAIIAVIAIPAGIILSRVRSKVVHAVVFSIANIGQSTPAIGLVILLAIVWETGFKVALIGLVAYSVLPVLRNTLVGIQQIDASLTEAARGMGMKPLQVLLRIELPLAVPVIIAGLRTALVFCVGVATVATFINAGGLGDMIVNGLKLQRWPVLVTGAVVVSCIALAIDWLAGLAEDLIKPKGT
ncbi:osmoprotectant transport system permease protein [Arthrobacter silviterrae]|uniref:ABC transporter permease n=1 Tax=Arthrobacter silviterrae TaxID=2026658 RepID=A0ABX0DKB3_9MICC|nr:ABC transporter permease [Arthrobacter silviterrae]MDQ0276485.1 osmoprotectant transport system permease protein [Arthrobacter silviterrae]NGN84677.1 ABC transporter permease [Arthrobacter silviterrae]